jgi:hypothetical protein
MAAEMMDEDDMVAPAGVALVGALAVVIFYWLHQLVFGIDLVTETGVEITLFIAAFLAQYIPLKILEDRLTT